MISVKGSYKKGFEAAITQLTAYVFSEGQLQKLAEDAWQKDEIKDKLEEK